MDSEQSCQGPVKSGGGTAPNRMAQHDRTGLDPMFDFQEVGQPATDATQASPLMVLDMLEDHRAALGKSPLGHDDDAALLPFLLALKDGFPDLLFMVGDLGNED